MPPKQKQVKKGPTYKTPTAAKDVVPATIKEPPRQPRPLKIPQQFPQVQANNNDLLQSKFQQWPSQQNLKTTDFTNGGNKFIDPFNKAIQQYVKNQTIFAWKSFEDISTLRANIPQQNESQEDQEEKFTKSLQNFEFVQKKAKIQQEAQGFNKENLVIETFMRQQTAQQLQRRKKEEQQKAQKAAKDKKKGKKQQPKQQGPIQISDVKMADILVRKSMCKQGIWIGSQLQMIKQRNLVDVYTAEPIWKKIYPQQNGVPILNKSGKYWVKLYYMGKQIKVEIDDTIPINSNVSQLFPVSEKKHEKWTLILSKALIKLIVKMGLTHDITGSGIIMYALTGMISQKIDLNQFEDWRSIENFLNDDHYTKKDVVLSCFVENNTKNMIYPPSNIAKNPNQLKNFILLENSSSPRKLVRNRKLSDHNLQHSDIRFSLRNQFDESIQPIMQSEIINGYSYCIGDYFSNHAFNMAFAKEKSQRQIKLRQQYNDLSKVSLSNKGRQQKLDHRRKKKQIKQKLQIQQKKRLENIGKAPIQYSFIKLLANIKINCEFSERQILLAKKCVINKLNQPPNYDMPVQKEKDQNKSNKSIAFSKVKQQISDTIPSIYDFSSIGNAQEPMSREDYGIWIKDKDLLASFTHFQILYNPNIYQNKSLIKITGDGKSFSFDENKQILLIERQKIQQEKQEQAQKNIELLFGFMWQHSKADNLYFPYTMLQKFNFENFVTTSNKIVLRDPLEATLINLPNQNNIFKIYTFAKSNYLYWISSYNKFKLLSISDYLTEYENYGKKNIPVQYPPMQSGIYNNLVKLKVQQQKNQDKNENTIILKLNQVKQQLIDYLNYRVIKVPKQNKFTYTQEQTEGVITKFYEQLLVVYQYTQIQIDSAYQYYISVQAFPSVNIQQGALQIIILNKNTGISIEQLQQVEPVKYVQKYQPNKYGLIFKQKLFTPIDNIVSLSIKLVQGEQGQPIQSTDKKGSKKGGKQQQTIEIIQKNMSKKRKIEVKILKNNQVVYFERGINEINISGIKLQSTKSQDIQYSIEGRFDLKDWPQAKVDSEDTNKIYWVIQVASQDTLAVVRDTTQQQREKEIRKSWQSAQVGRSDKAKKARRKFLIQMKKANGEQLTQQQIQILNAPRLTKKQQIEEQKKNEDKKGGKGGKKDDKKGAKKQEAPVEQKPIQREPPKSQDNFMIQIKKFLQKLENCEVEYEKISENDSQRIRSQEEIRAINQGAIMAQQNRVGRLLRNVQNRQTQKIKEKDKKQKLQIFFSEKKTQFKEKWVTYVQWRQKDQEKDRSKQQKQKALVDIINQEKPTVNQADLKKLIVEYQNIQGHNPAIADVADMVRKNIRIAVLTEKITNLLPGWQVEQLKNIAAQIQTDKIIGIDDQVIKNMNQMLQQVAKNPGIVAQKQAEAKKNKKGGKK